MRGEAKSKSEERKNEERRGEEKGQERRKLMQTPSYTIRGWKVTHSFEFSCPASSEEDPCQ